MSGRRRCTTVPAPWRRRRVGGHRQLAFVLGVALLAGSCTYLDGEVERQTTRRIIEEGAGALAPAQAPTAAQAPAQDAAEDAQAGAAATGQIPPAEERDPGEPASTGPSPDDAAPVVADIDGPLVLGTIQPLSGAERELGEPMMRTTEAWVADVNERGGIAGRQVELRVEAACLNCQDDALTAARRLVEEEGVFAVINTYMLIWAMTPAANYLEEQGVPLIGGASDAMTDLSLRPNTFFFTSHNFAEPRAWARFLHQRFEEQGRALDIGVVHLEAAEGAARAGGFTEAWEALGGRVVATESIRAEEEAVTRMDGVVMRMRSSGAQGVFAANNVLMVFGEIAAQRQGWSVPWGAHSAWGEAVPNNCGNACDGDYTTTIGWQHPSAGTAGMRRYLDATARFYPDATHDAQTIGAWLHGVVLEHVIASLEGPLTRAAVLAGLESLDGLDTGLTVAPITTGPGDHQGIASDQFLQLRGTTWELIGTPMANR